MGLLRRSDLSIFAVFFFESSVLGQWIPRIPDIKNALGLTDGTLGLALLALPMGTLLGLSMAGLLIERIGLRNTCRFALPMFALLFIAPALAGSLIQLMLALVATGVVVGLCETAMNTEAARLEKSEQRRLMSRCHGFWSLGTMFGALTGAALAQLGVSMVTHFLMVLPLIAICGYFAASSLPILAESEQETTVGKSDKIIRLPHPSMLLLCILPLGIMMVEGAFIDWSAVFMHDIMHASPWVIGVTYSFFSIVMAVVRLSGDYLADRFGDLAIVRTSGVAATIGITLFALAPTTTVALAAAALAGAGVAVVFPLAVTAAANRPGRSSADNVAALNFIAFSGFLMAPPLIGFMSELFSLRIALLALAPLTLATVFLAGEIKPRSGD